MNLSFFEGDENEVSLVGGTPNLPTCEDITGLGQESAVDLFPESQRTPFFSGAHVHYHGQGSSPSPAPPCISPVPLMSGTLEALSHEARPSIAISLRP